MKKLILILLLSFIFASPASATVYKWMDERGVVTFTDNPDKIPPAYRDRVEEVSIPKRGPSTSSQVPFAKAAANVQAGKAGTQAPSIAQTLIREGDFAVKLAEALKLGPVAGEAEAESMLVSVGIAPRNGWIADYPLTPDIIGELQNSIGEAVDSGGLAMKKDEAMKALQDLTAQQDLPLRADDESRDAGAEPPRDYGEYSNPTVINNYYYNEGPPVVTYYPPPPDYRYLYVWVPYPFWCSRFWFAGFFALNDFDRGIFVNRRLARITNHVTDPKTRRVFPIDPATRGHGKFHHNVTDVSHRKRFASPDAERSAASILMHSHDRARLGNSKPSEVRSVPERQIPSHGKSDTSADGGRVIGVRPPTTNQRMDRSQTGIDSRSMGGGSSGHQGGFSNVGRVPSVRPSVPTPKSSVPAKRGSSREFPGRGLGSGGSPRGGTFGGR